MAELVVRGLENDVKERLQCRAKAHGRSIEAEVRDILCDAVAVQGIDSGSLGTRIVARFEGIGLDAPIPELRAWDFRTPDFTE